jgi:hypothetical protein
METIRVTKIMLIVLQTNIFGVGLGSGMTMALSDVSCAAVDQVILNGNNNNEDVVFGSRRVRHIFDGTARRAWALNYCLLDSARTRIPLLLGDTAKTANTMNEVARVLNRPWTVELVNNNGDGLDGGGGGSGNRNEPRCVVCLTRPVAIALLPCRHVCSCVMCGQALMGASCPVCRARVESTMRMFMV